MEEVFGLKYWTNIQQKLDFTLPDRTGDVYSRGRFRFHSDSKQPRLPPELEQYEHYSTKGGTTSYQAAVVCGGLRHFFGGKAS